MSGLKSSDVYKVVKIIEQENLPNSLSNMSKNVFLKKVEWIIEHNILKRDPFCSFCLKKFQNKKDRDNHIKYIHNNIKNEKLCCKVCDKSFMSRVSVKYHMKVCHSSASPKVKCEVCNKVLGHAITLRRHMKIHEDSELFKCDQCERKFKRKDKLTGHKKTVHKCVNMAVDLVEILKKDDEKYNCTLCKMVFTGLEGGQQLVDHLVNNCKPDERFPCDACDKDFSTKFNLDQHKKSIHYVEAKAVFSCQFCGFITKHKTSLTRHTKRMHEGF